LHPLIAVLLIAALVFALALLWLEARHRLRPASPLQLSSEGWKVKQKSDQLVVVKGRIRIHNPHPRMEVFVPELHLEPTLLGRGDLGGLTVTTAITPQQVWICRPCSGALPTGSSKSKSTAASGGALAAINWASAALATTGAPAGIAARDGAPESTGTEPVGADAGALFSCLVVWA